MNKYKLTGETMEFMGKILYRIIACKTFEYAHKGSLVDGLNHIITYHKMAAPGFPTTFNLIK